MTEYYLNKLISKLSLIYGFTCITNAHTVIYLIVLLLSQIRESYHQRDDHKIRRLQIGMHELDQVVVHLQFNLKIF